MRRTILFFVLIFTVFIGVVFSAEKPVTPAKATPGTDIKAESNQGREVVIRFYKNIKEQPDVFEKITLTGNKNSKWFKCDFKEVGEASFVVIAESDQHDETVKKLLGKSVGGWPCNKRTGISLHGKPLAGRRVTLKDAIGNVLADAKVEVILETRKEFGTQEFTGTEMITDANGICTIPELNDGLKFSRFIFENRDRSKAVFKRGYLKGSTVPFVRPDTKAYDRSIRGWVLDPEGNPVAGASVMCQFAYTLGGVMIHPRGGIPYYVQTNEKGFFSMYLPSGVNRDRPNRGSMIPPNSDYDVRITAPEQYRLLPYIGKINNSKEVTIELEDAGTYHTFAFMEGDKRINDKINLSGIYVRIEREGKPDLSKINWRDGGYFPNGVYKAQIYVGSYRDEFEPLEVNENSPEELLFTLRKNINCRGQVVNAMTGAGIKGAFIVGAYSTYTGRDLCQITDEQWEQMQNLGDHPDINDPVLKPLHDIYLLNAITRTGQDGKFNFDFFPVGKYYKMLVFDKDFLEIYYRRKSWKGNANGFLELPLTKLYPSGMVTIEATGDQRPKMVYATWLVNKDSIPRWAEGILSIQSLILSYGVHSTETDIYFAHRQKRLSKHSFPVPAGLDLRIRLDTAYNTLWCPVIIDDTVMLEQGQSLDLGVWPLAKAYPANVQVVDSLGKPVEGLPVKAVNDTFTSKISNTDENGISIIQVPPDFDGDFVVQYGGSDAKKTYSQKVNLNELSGQEDTSPVFTIVLTDN